MRGVFDTISSYGKEEGVVESITHAPNIESALITLIDPRLRMNDIGGSFKPGENFIVTVDYIREHCIGLAVVRYGDLSRSVSLEEVRDLVYKQ